MVKYKKCDICDRSTEYGVVDTCDENHTISTTYPFLKFYILYNKDVCEYCMTKYTDFMSGFFGVENWKYNAK